jgi:hypothetical protein
MLSAIAKNLGAKIIIKGRKLKSYRLAMQAVNENI